MTREKKKQVSPTATPSSPLMPSRTTLLASSATDSANGMRQAMSAEPRTTLAKFIPPGVKRSPSFFQRMAPSAHEAEEASAAAK